MNKLGHMFLCFVLFAALPVVFFLVAITDIFEQILRKAD